MYRNTGRQISKVKQKM